MKESKQKEIRRFEKAEKGGILAKEYTEYTEKETRQGQRETIVERKKSNTNK